MGRHKPRPARNRGPHPSRTTLAARARQGSLRARVVTRSWVALAVLVAVMALGGTMVAASVDASSRAHQARQDFTTTAGNIAARVALTLQWERDLMVSTGAFIALDRNVANSQFERWVAVTQALKLYPEVRSVGFVTDVAASGLAAFARRQAADPAGSLTARRLFLVTPAGARPSYCLAAAMLQRPSLPAVPAGTDYCAGSRSAVLLGARDSGVTAFLPASTGGARELAVFVPTYRGGGVPATVAARRRAFVGWVYMTASPRLLLTRALGHIPGYRLTLSIGGGSPIPPFVYGMAGPGATTTASTIAPGWTMRAAAVVPGGSLLSHESGVILIDGTIVSLLAGVLVFVLGSGRARARRLVALRTAELRHQALHDALTGLPNRALILDRLEWLCARSRRTGTASSVLFVDLDDFKAVNDTLGHEAGDELLRRVASRLRLGLRDVDTVGRLGGDEFVILLDGEAEPRAQLVAERLLALLHEPFALDAAIAPLVVTASIGGAVGCAQSSSDLLRDADMALYQAKAVGKDRYEIFQPALENAVRHRLELQRDLQGALANGQFRLVYQPVYRARDLALLGAEALLRWQHPQLGVIPPGQFIPLLEGSGGIHETGRWALETACREAARWHAAGTPLVLSVNVSGRQLDDDAIVEDIRHALESSGLEPGALTIEITETALMRDAHATALRLNAIATLGVSLAIDDFGTGYSSLASLQRLPVDKLKIDRAFVAGVGQSPQSNALFHTLVALARAFGLRTLAEGVETLDQLEYARHERVDAVQGFLLSRPLDAEAMRSLAAAAPVGVDRGVHPIAGHRHAPSGQLVHPIAGHGHAPTPADG